MILCVASPKWYIIGYSRCCTLTYIEDVKTSNWTSLTTEFNLRMFLNKNYIYLRRDDILPKYFPFTLRVAKTRMIIKHELNPMVAYNDQRGRWMVVQCMINGETCDFVGLYATNASRGRALLWQEICAYAWPQNAFICGDFNNSPNTSDNTIGHLHMLREERNKWYNMQSSLDWADLWKMTHPHVHGFTFHHINHSSFYAWLDRWYLLHASQYENFTCTMHIDHALQFWDHAPV